MKCPGQDTRYWKPEDIFNVPCPACDRPVEFFKDDSSRRCPACGYRFRNPRLDLGCAEWCPYAKQCLGETGNVTSDKADDSHVSDDNGAAKLKEEVSKRW